MSPLTLINYDLDIPYLLKLADKVKNQAEPYIDPRFEDPIETWKILMLEDPYLTKIMEDLNIQAVPRFYWQEPNSVLAMHTDYYTKCSVNFVITEDPAPIIIEDKEYTYKQAILDTTRMHGVNTQDKERILLKLSITNKTYEETVDDMQPFIV